MMEKIIEDEEKNYQVLAKKLYDSRDVVRTDEHNLLMCLQKLAPAQNMYLRGIIRGLQKKHDTDKATIESLSKTVQKLRVDEQAV